MSRPDNNALGTVLRSIRWRKDLTQAVLAQRAGLSRGMIAAVETGIKKIRSHHMDSILRATDLEWKRGLDQTWSKHHGDDYCLVRPGAEILIVHRGTDRPFIHARIEGEGYARRLVAIPPEEGGREG